MNPLKKLVGQTAIYGLPTIVGRLLNYFLVPLYTYVLVPGEYGVVTELYAYVAFLMVILTYGMETAFFRFSKKENSENVYSTSIISLLFSSFFFILIACLFAPSISTVLGYANHTEYIIWFAWILGLDALSAVPFARLREMNKARRFALLKSVNIALQLGFNLFFIALCPWIDKNVENGFVRDILHQFYNPSIRVGYIFISNLLATVITLLLLIPDILKIKLYFDKKLWKQMLKYALPIMIWGMAGIVNETFDRILLKHLVPVSENPMAQLGIYGACYKISILMTLFIQTFKFAAEPFFFSHASREDARQIYADVMKYFIIVCAFIFLGVMMYIDLIIFFVGKEYRVGAAIIPILLMANLCLGVFYNLSIWYKITDKTMYGAYISVFGAIVTLVLNFWLVPVFGYMGAAWATLICYFSIMFISYLLGQKHYRINYDLKKIVLFTGLALLLYFISTWINIENLPIKLSLNTAFVLFYIAIVVYTEKEVFRKVLKKSND